MSGSNSALMLDPQNAAATLSLLRKSYQHSSESDDFDHTDDEFSLCSEDLHPARVAEVVEMGQIDHATVPSGAVACVACSSTHWAAGQPHGSVKPHTLAPAPAPAPASLNDSTRLHKQRQPYDPSPVPAWQVALALRLGDAFVPSEVTVEIGRLAAKKEEARRAMA